ncbi:hypothetical protein B0H17DRAFT_1324544 [Mycena rosella]|uniref:Uncharacterized protein n=1 Tax=Mycena rosella TaxID=1033263 RepID=A0AAD7H1B1_MYCRO|nr:hypothetical protein B0H17DRAFT_1324544 [Mycena rosella]
MSTPAHSRYRSFHLNLNASEVALHPIPTPPPTLTLAPPRAKANLNSDPRGTHSEVSLNIGTGIVGIGLLALARQASAAAYALLGLGGCAPGVGVRGGRAGARRVPRGIVCAGEEIDSKQDDGAEAPVQEIIGVPHCVHAIVETKTTEERVDLDLEKLEVPDDCPDAGTEAKLATREATSLTSSPPAPQIYAHPCEEDGAPQAEYPASESEHVDSPPSASSNSAEEATGLEVPAEPAAPLIASHAAEDPAPPQERGHRDSPIELGKRTSTDLEAPVPLVAPEHPAVCSPHVRAELRADLLRRINIFTAARISRGAPGLPLPRTAAPISPPPPRPAPADDPFAAADAPPFAHRAPAPFVPAHPLGLRFPSLQRASRPDQQQSPTPQPRAPGGRPPLRQQTVFFKHNQAQAEQWQSRADTPTKQPAFWAPHPAGKRSCAVVIKAPPGASRAAGNKENCAVV